MEIRGTIRRSVEVVDLDVARDGRTVTAYATPFDHVGEIKDQHGHYFETWARRSFAKWLTEGGPDRVLVLANHGLDLHGQTVPEFLIPVAESLEVRADGKGLLTRARYYRHPIAQTFLDGILSGALKSYSHESAVLRSRKIGSQGGLPIFEHVEARMHEYGPAMIPQFAEGAEILTVRSATLADELLDLDVDSLNATDRADLAAILKRQRTSAGAPGEEPTLPREPQEPKPEEDLDEDPTGAERDSLTPDKAEAEARALATLRADLEARRRRK